MASPRFLRYLAPNLITLSSMIFGLVSLWAAHEERPDLAAWMIIYAVLTDRLDGLVARAVKGTSELGMQLDSFADFLNFGVAPAYLVLTYLSGRSDLPYYDGGSAHTWLFVACGAYMLCAVFRLARYNVLSDERMALRPFGGAKVFGEGFVTAPWVWTYFPIFVVVMGYLMASRLPMPKVGMTKNKAVSVVLLAFLAAGYVGGFAMRYPELLAWMPIFWSVVFLFWGQASAKWRAMYPPPLFPKREPEKPLIRPQADLEDLVLDESPSDDKT